MLTVWVCSSGLLFGEQGLSRRSPLGAAPEVRSLPVVEMQEAIEAGLQLSDRGEVMTAEGDAPMFLKKRSLESLDEAIRPGVPRLDPVPSTFEDPVGCARCNPHTVSGQLRRQPLRAPGRPGRQRQGDHLAFHLDRYLRWSSPRRGTALRAKPVGTVQQVAFLSTVKDGAGDTELAATGRNVADLGSSGDRVNTML